MTVSSSHHLHGQSPLPRVSPPPPATTILSVQVRLPGGRPRRGEGRPEARQGGGVWCTPLTALGCDPLPQADPRLLPSGPHMACNCLCAGRSRQMLRWSPPPTLVHVQKPRSPPPILASVLGVRLTLVQVSLCSACHFQDSRRGALSSAPRDRGRGGTRCGDEPAGSLLCTPPPFCAVPLGGLWGVGGSPFQGLAFWRQEVPVRTLAELCPLPPLALPLGAQQQQQSKRSVILCDCAVLLPESVQLRLGTSQH